MDMRQRLADLRSAVADLRKSTALPYWRLGFVEFLLTRAEECLAVCRLPEAEGLAAKAENWLKQNRPTPANAGHAFAEGKDDGWDAPLIRANLDRVRGDLQRKRRLVPAPEREAFEQGLARVEKLLSEQRNRPARMELEQVRGNLIRRLQRSYRARAHVAPLVRAADGTVVPSVRVQRDPLQPVGPYNNQRLLDDVTLLVGERDPIWVEDFVELYNNLRGYLERLGPSDKSKRTQLKP